MSLKPQALNARLLLLSSFLLILISALVGGEYYIEPIDDSTPQFQLTFMGSDSPIQIIASNLTTRPPSTLIPLTVIPDASSRIFFFVFDGYLVNGDYTFHATAYDEDENFFYFHENFTVQAPSMNMWISDPTLSFFSPEKQHVAVAPVVPYTITLQTEYPSYCRVVPNQLPYDELLFENALAQFDEGTATYATTHDLTLIDGLAQEIHELQVAQFSATNYDLYNRYLVMCKQATIPGEPDELHVKTFYFGYDLTPPSLVADFDPNPLEDASMLNTIAYDVDSDDLIACSYDFPVNPAPTQNDTPGTIPNTVTDITSYQQSHTKMFDYYGQHHLFTEGQHYDYELALMCENLAGHQSSLTSAFIINISREFNILLEELFYATSNPTLNIQTTKLATCYYNDEPIGSDTLKLNHPLSLENLEDGYHDISIFCRSDFDLQWQDFTFLTDTIYPSQPSILGGEYSCGMNIELDVAQPNKPMTYTISLYNSSTTTPEHLVYGPYTTPQFINDSYHLDITPYVDARTGMLFTWEVTGTDLLGQNSTTVTKEFVVNDENEIVCDTTAPTSLVEIGVFSGGFTLDLTCMDSQSGCTPTFLYSYLEPGASCTYPPGQTGTYNETLEVTRDGMFCYQVWDRANNVYSGEQEVSVSLDIDLMEPLFGVAPTKNFLFSVNTSRNAICRQGFYAQAVPPELVDWYYSLNEFTTTGGELHSVVLTGEDIIPGQSFEEALANWVVICDEDGLYHVQDVGPIGYDITPPQLTLTAQPNPIVDPAVMTTALQLQADDPVVCTYLDENAVPIGFSGYNPTNKESYVDVHRATAHYWNKPNAHYEQEVVCKNLAGNIEQIQLNITLDLRDEVNIQFHTPQYLNSRSFLFNVSTLQQADCIYRMGNSTQTQQFTTTGAYTHTKQLTLDEGEHELAVICQARGSQDQGYAVKKFTIDTRAPELELVSLEQTCSLENIEVNFLASGTGSPLDRFNYTLRNASGTLLTGEQESMNFKTVIDLVQGTTYTLSVFAFDKAGNSIAREKALLASAFDSLLCDTTAPRGDVELYLVWGGTEIVVLCEDEQSGCSDSFSYTYDANGFCEEGFLASSYDELPLMSSTDASFCYRIFDKAGNNFSSQVDLEYDAQCYNGIQDPDEEGVDCGGPCFAQCGLCENGIRDAFEEGVDCGGSCEHIRSCQESSAPPLPEPPSVNNTTAPPPPSGPECFTNSQCADNERCLEGECVERTTPTPPSLQEESKDILGLILLIIGLLLFLGGGGFIYYWRTKKENKAAQQRQQAQTRYQQQSQQNRQQSAEQQQRQKEYLASIKKKREEEQKTRETHVKERKEKRKSLLEVFKTPETEKKEYEEEKFPVKKDDQQNKKDSQQSEKLDEGHEEDYVDVRELGKKPKQKPEKITRNQKGNKPATTKKDVFAGLANLASDAQQPTSKKDKNQKESFAALQNMISSIKGKDATTSSPSEKVSSQEFLTMFENKNVQVKKLDTQTLVSILRLLLDQKKLDMKTVKEILPQLAQRGHIAKEQSVAILAQLST